MKATKLLSVGLLLTCLVMGLLPGLTLAAPSQLPPPPPRETPAPGGTIILYVHTSQTGLASVVQWEDGLGNWHDVDGWRSELTWLTSYVFFQPWWVAPKDLGTGPFRWLIYNPKTGKTVGTTNSFYLPMGGGVVTMQQSLTP
jgi:hypothetical protein